MYLVGTVLALLLERASSSSTFNLVKMTNPDAVCLDGSPSAIYISEGEEKNKFLLHFQGGGWCSGTNVNLTLSECLSRSKTQLGSSKAYPASKDFTSNGWLSGDPNHNPEFYNWTRVFINYCTGTGHQGHITKPVVVNGTELYFRGHDVTLQIFSYMENNYKMLTGNSTVFLGGQSAGGLAVYTWADYLKQKVVGGKMYAVPDSGYFNDEASVKTGQFVYRQYMQSLTSLVNVEVDHPNKACAAYYNKQQWRCMLLDYLYPFLHTDMLIVQSLYDTWVSLNIFGISCAGKGITDACSPAEKAVLENHRVKTLRFLGDLASPYYSSAFVFACTHHCLLSSPNYYGNNYVVYNKNLQKVMADFKARRFTNGYFDTQPWPSNQGCSNLGSTYQLY